MTAMYSSTKAALQSCVLSQRYKLKNTTVSVLEIAPPWVQTDWVATMNRGQTKGTCNRVQRFDVAAAVLNSKRARTIVAEGDFVIVRGRFSGFGQLVNWIAEDIVRMKDGTNVSTRCPASLFL